MRSSSLQSYMLAAGLTGLPVLSLPALAQQPIALPGITVQGATLEAPPPRPAPAAPSQAPAAAPGETTALSTEQSAIAGVPAYTVGNAVTVVTGEELRARQIRYAAEALRSLPGVSVGRSGGFGNITQVRIRGAEGNHTLVLIDGIEANNTADGEFDFSNLSADDIERIEIIRGPMSGLYGSNAVGGVINIITRRGQGPLTLTVRTEGGSMGTTDVAGRVAVGNDKAHLSVSYQVRETAGYNIAPVGDEDDGSRLGTFTMRAGATLLPGVTLDFTVRKSDKQADRDGFGGPAGTLATAIDDRSTLDHRVFLAGGNLRWDMLGGALTHELRINHNSTITADTDRSFFASFSRNISEAEKYAYLATYRLNMPALWMKHAFTGRVEKEDERFTPFGDFADGLERARGRMAYTGEWRGDFADRLFLTAGIRRDDNDNFQDFTTWRAAASLVLKELYMRPHASVGTAVKLPTMYEQFGTSPVLRAERRADAGGELRLGRRRRVHVLQGRGDPGRDLFQLRPHQQDQRHRAGAASGYVHVGQPAGREHARGCRGGGPLQAHARDHARRRLHLHGRAQPRRRARAAAATACGQGGPRLRLHGWARHRHHRCHLQRPPGGHRVPDAVLLPDRARAARRLLAAQRHGLLQDHSGRGGVRAR